MLESSVPPKAIMNGQRYIVIILKVMGVGHSLLGVDHKNEMNVLTPKIISFDDDAERTQKIIKMKIVVVGESLIIMTTNKIIL